jgi:5-carboxymethyl-2-hydroxymuconate isomerase
VPHIHLETSADLIENDRIPDLLHALVDELSKHETIASASIKAYHTLRGTWVMGGGAPQGFAHCTCSVLSGRPLELRQRISAAMYETMKRIFAESVSQGEAGLTFDLREMDKETYMK